jgi:hypothetical protein
MLPRPGRATSAALTGAGYAKVVATVPGHLQAVRDFLIDIFTPGELSSLAVIGGRVHDGLGPTRTWHLPRQ